MAGRSFLKALISKIIRVAGLEMIQRRALHLKAGANITLTPFDSAANDETVVTIASTASGGASAADELTVDDSAFNILTGTDAQTLFDDIDDLMSGLNADYVDADGDQMAGDLDFDGNNVLNVGDAAGGLNDITAQQTAAIATLAGSGAAATFALTDVPTGKRHKYRIEIETRVGSSYEYFESIVIARNVSGTVTVAVAEETLLFPTVDYVITYPISGTHVVITFTNNTGTTIDSIVIKVTKEEGDNA